jgi:multidrug efflux pump subunit AcrA (membrane-fusion protein)
VLDGALADAPLGATVTIRIAEERATPQNVLPIGAVFDAGKGPGVWVVAGSPAQVSWRPVKILGLDDAYARIESGLKAGDRIVTLGANLLREGEKVRVAEREGATRIAGEVR